jgi:hypothetical protein
MVANSAVKASCGADFFERENSEIVDEVAARLPIPEQDF